MKTLLKLAVVAVIGVSVSDVQAMMGDQVYDKITVENGYVGARLVRTDRRGRELPQYQGDTHNHEHTHFQHYYRSLSDFVDLEGVVNPEDRETLRKAARITNALNLPNSNYRNENIAKFCDWWWHSENSVGVHELMRSLIENKLQKNLSILHSARDVLTSLRSIDNAVGMAVLPVFFGDTDRNSFMRKLYRGETNLTVDDQRALLEDMSKFCGIDLL